MIAQASGSVLYLDDVSVSFDGFKALNSPLVLQPGEMRAIIGPNGAVDLTTLDEVDIAELGIGRKFQKPTVFESQTVFDNLELALKIPRGPFSTLFHRRSEPEKARINELLELIRLTDRRDELAANLSHGQKQWREIGMLLAQDPKLMLVDELAAGMTDAETAQTATMLKEINKTRSVVVVEHDMTFV